MHRPAKGIHGLFSRPYRLPAKIMETTTGLARYTPTLMTVQTTKTKPCLLQRRSGGADNSRLGLKDSQTATARKAATNRIQYE